MHQYGLKNELDYVEFFDRHIKNGIKNFTFKGDNGLSRTYRNISSSVKTEKITRRSDGVCNKCDVSLIDYSGKSYPLSLKMNNTKTSWESADSSLKNILYDFINCYGRVDVANNIHIKIDDHDEDMEKYVFGDDIISDGGAVLIQTMQYADYFMFNNDTVVLNCDRIFYEYSHIEVDNKYKPVIIVRKDGSRNKSCDIIRGYRIEVVPNYTSTEIKNIVV